MPVVLFDTSISPIDYFVLARRAIPVLVLVLCWCWETWRPFIGQRHGRLRHASRNLAIAVGNTIVLAMTFGGVTAAVATDSEAYRWGLFNCLKITGLSRFVLTFVLLDGGIYTWHRANHIVPLLWRFHRMHHSDRHMDVTTATRFHLGEHVGAVAVRLALIPILGVDLWILAVYDTVLVAVTQFHHADISIGRWDCWLRLVIVTPAMHKVHHSDRQPETDSNYASVLSFWDRLFGSYRVRLDTKAIQYGLTSFTHPAWQTCWGMMKTPFVNRTTTPVP